MSHQETITKDLPVRLSEEELAARAQALANRIENAAKLKLEQKEAAQGYSARIKDEEKSIAELANAVAHKREKRPVLCVIEYQTRQCSVATIRTDTGETIDSRAMTSEELEDARQGTLFPGQADDRVAPPSEPDVDPTCVPGTVVSLGTGQPANEAAPAAEELPPGTEITPDLLDAAERAVRGEHGDH